MKIEGKGGSKKQKKGQITIFIILGILIVSGILIFFLYIRPTYFPPAEGKLNFEGCVKRIVLEKTDMLGKTAGYRQSAFYYQYNGDKIPYLCYSGEYYKPCTIQMPFLKQHFEKNLLDAAKPEILACIDSTIEDLRARGFEVNQGKREVKIEIIPKTIRVSFDIPVTIRKGENVEQGTLNPVDIPNPMYELLMLSTSLLQFEARYGDSDVSMMMIFYPEVIVDKLKQGDETKVYILQNKDFGTKFQFASRSYAWPPGYGISGVIA